MKPILFNTDMVEAILDGRKTVTRRQLKCMVHSVHAVTGDCIKHYLERAGKMPYQVGDGLYVRETWQFIPCIDCAMSACQNKPVVHEDAETVGEGCFVFKASYPETKTMHWRPSIHMPEEAARIFLKVTAVRVERLQSISRQQCHAEGIVGFEGMTGEPKYMEQIRGRAAQTVFSELWESTIKKQDRPAYGWDANPWVWVIEFERLKEVPHD
ncbi:hypothetical protein RFF05_06675 [Bengtsoniella intestinalis]|uniref:hypothetical protein n=1 Tax=Bengtsoniella intestinalis TaxID=3073143 RepID=UPI00391F01D3